MRQFKSIKITFSFKLAIIAALFSIFFNASFPQIVQAQSSGLADADVIAQLPLAGERAPRKIMKVILTAYSSTPSQTDSTPFITANGTYVYDGLIAANWLTFGARVKFPELFGDKIFTVNDRMHQRFGRGRLDLWLDLPLDEVKAFGVKKAVMEIY